MSELYDEPTRRVMLDVEMALAGADSYIESPGKAPVLYADHLVRLAGLPHNDHAELSTALETRAKLDNRELTGLDRIGVVASSIGRRMLWDRELHVQPGFLVRERAAEAPLPMAGNSVDLSVRCTHYLGVMCIGRQYVTFGDEQPVYEAAVFDSSGGGNAELAYVRYVPSRDRPAAVLPAYDMDDLIPGLPSDPSAADVFRAASRTIREYYAL